MKQLGLFVLLCMLTGISGATFELEDPADPDNMVIEKKNSGAARAENSMIVPVGTPMYEPEIIQGECRGWHLDGSQSSTGNDDRSNASTKTTYMGVIIKTIDCHNEQDGTTMHFAIVQVNQVRLIWVEKDKILSAK